MVIPRPTLSRERQEPAAPDGLMSEAAVRVRPARVSSAGAGGTVFSPPSPAWVLVARLVRPHGRRGELVAEILTDFPERFHDRHRLFLIPPERVGSRPREMHMENFWFQRSRIVMKFQGVDSINEAEALRGFAVAIPAAERVALDAGSLYVSDLIGCRVIDLNRDGFEVGVVTEVDRQSSSTDLLVVHPAERRGQGELLIPFAAKYVVQVDPMGRRLEMRLPAGLLEINHPMTEEEKREQEAGSQ